MKKIIYLIFLILIVSCSEETLVEPEEEIIEEDVWSVNKENQYALNVVIFNPTDFYVGDEMVQKVSTMILFVQKWYEKQMDLQGFGKKTFGLITNQHNEVKITIVQGSKTSSHYKTVSNPWKVIDDEVNLYFSNHANERESKHTFILGKPSSGVPFVGFGKSAFAVSNNFKLVSTGKFIEELELMTCDKLGGVLHELGHGLNLPHNCHKASDMPKIALMSYGNHSYQINSQSDLVYLTKASCAILDANEIFNTKNDLYYGENPILTMGAYTVKKDQAKQATIVDGIVISEVKPTYLYIGHDGYPTGRNWDYDKITWTVPLVETAVANEYSFHVEMPYSDIFNGYKAKDVLTLSMNVITENGYIKTPISYDYTIGVLSPEPNDDILTEHIPFVFSDRTKWTVSANSYAPPLVSSNMIDGDYGTYWHSEWPYTISSKGNHEITINMGESKNIEGVYLYSTRIGTQYRPKQVSVKTSSDGVTWVVAKEITIEGLNAAKEVYITFDNVITANYFKIVVSEIYASNNNTEENLIINEVDVF